MDTQTPPEHHDEDAEDLGAANAAAALLEPTGNKRDGSGQRDALGHFTAGNTEGNRWQPGESGHPEGRPKAETSLTTLFKRAMDAPNPDGEGTVAQAITATVVAKAIKGDMEAIKYLGDRLEGKPTVALALASGEDSPLHYRLTVIDGGPRPAALPPGENGADTNGAST